MVGADIMDYLTLALLLVIFAVVLALFIYALCRISSDADDAIMRHDDTDYDWHEDKE